MVADVDLAKFFDRANHDMVTERLSRKIAEKGVLGLIRRYLEAGVMVSGVMVERHEGTPQGGPLSPLLANALLALKKLFGKLRLVVNEEKSAVDLAWRRDFLGYSFWVAAEGRIRRRVARKALAAMKERVREITNRNGGRSLSAVAGELRAYLLGWRSTSSRPRRPASSRTLTSGSVTGCGAYN